ncbi:MAG TPA: FHA domain-containing protein [Polyangiaceae bacterium]|nr:FHA domain-containing protein [Polyangiaceae bacterium]
MPITLVVRSGETAIAAPTPPSITFDLPRVVIGRSDGCDLRLPDLSVSQRHATIRQRGSEYIVVDEGSSNGTFIGPVRLHPQSPRIVRNRELLRVGRIWIEVRIEPVAPTNQAGLATRELALALVDRALDDQGEPARPRLFVSVGPDCTKSLDLSENLRPFVLGRGRDTDLTLDLPEASRRHAQVTRKGDVLLVRDLGSRQGTHGEQGPLPADRDTPMRVGESFTIGADRFVFEYPAVEALKELERASDEPLAARDVPPAPASNDDTADPVDLQGTDLSPALPSATPSPPPSQLPSPVRAPRKPSRSGWSKTDFAVVLLALIVLGLSAVGLLWLFRGS